MSSALEILDCYFRRRGYFYENMTHGKTGFSSVDEVTSTLDNYFTFLDTLTPAERVSLNFLNFELCQYLNEIDSEILPKLCEHVSVDHRFNFCVLESTIAKLASFLSSTTNKNKFIKIFTDFMTRNYSATGNHCKFNFHEAPPEYQDDTVVCHQFSNEENQVISCDLSIDRSDSYLGMENGQIFIVKNSTGHVSQFYAHSGPVFDVKVLPCDQNYVLSASFDQSIKLWDMKFRQKYFKYEGHSAAVLCLDFDYTNSRFVSGSADTKCCLFDFELTRPVRVLAYHSDAVQRVQFADTLVPGQRSVVITASADRKVCLWSVDQAKPVRLYGDFDCPLMLISHHPTSHLLIVGSEDRKLHVLDIRNDKSLQIFDLGDLTPFSLDFNRRSGAGNRQFYVGGQQHAHNSVGAGVLSLKKLEFSSCQLIEFERNLQVQSEGRCWLVAAKDSGHDFISVVASH